MAALEGHGTFSFSQRSPVREKLTGLGRKRAAPPERISLSHFVLPVGTNLAVLQLA